MSLLNPLALLGLLLVPIAVALSLWRWREQDVWVPSLIFWDRTDEYLKEQSQTRVSRIDPLLVLHLLVIALGVLGMAEPVLRGRGRVRTNLVIVADLTASIKTVTDRGRTRWQDGLSQLERVLGRLSSDDRVAVLSVPETTGAGLSFAYTAAEAGSRLRALKPTDCPGEPSSVLQTAVSLARGSQNGKVVVCTDSAEALPDVSGCPLLCVDVGGPSKNYALVGFAVDGRAQQVLVACGNYSEESAKLPVAIEVDGAEKGRRTLELAPSERRPVIFECDVSSARTVRVALLAEDALATDNVAWAVRASTRRLRCGVVGTMSPFVDRALRLHPFVEVARLESAEAAGSGEADLLIWNRAEGELPSGRRIVVVGPRGSVGPIRATGQLSGGTLMTVKADDPLMSSVNLDGVNVARAAKVEVPPGFDTLATLNGEPVIGRVRGPDKELIYIGFDLQDSDWPLRASFPIFWGNVVAESLDSLGARDGLTHFRTGHQIDVSATSDEGVQIAAPSGARHSLRIAASGSARYVPVEVGIHTMGDGEQQRRLAVNLLDEDESHTAGRGSIPTDEEIDAFLASETSEKGLRLSPYLFACCLACAVAGWAFRRRFFA